MLKLGDAAALPPFRVMDVIAAANARAARLPAGSPKVIRMMAGQPATGAPRGAAEAAARAMLAGAPLGYTETRGNLALRERIAAHYQDWYGSSVDPARIFVTTGASAAFPLAFLAAFNRGDTIALAAPYYPPYVNIMRALGLRPLILQTDATTRFQPSLAMLKALDPPPAGLLVASPCNPAGTMLSAAELAAIGGWCACNGVRLISDEIYHGLTYGLAQSSALATEGAVIINSFSKYFSMTGWRIGWMVLPPDLVRAVDCLAGNFYICAPHVAQLAALAAFDCTRELDGNVAQYARNRQALLAALPGAGLPEFAAPDGAFYVYADVSSRDADSSAFCARLLEEAGIAFCPGIDFDDARGHRFVRMSYCGAEADLQEAAERLARWHRTGHVPGFS